APTTAFGFESNEVDATSLLDFSESAAPWLVSSAQVYEGSFALESPPISDTAKAVVTTQITVPPTNTNVSGLSFAIRIGGQLFGSKLTLTIRDSNGLVVKNDTWNGNWEWHEMAYQLTPDTYTIKWSFENPNDDVDAKAWIDQVLVTAPQATP
ncbi:MAG: hypothetical protein OEX19_04970, partial [Gammaproteobacteria bacterium]|nr:hypothetical protein [Gammaproteobacteria bacterium]